MSNASNGYAFEVILASLLSKAGFWVHRIVPNAGGQQPADLIVVRGTYHTLIDCKDCATRRGFSFDRIEVNQRMSMDRFADRGVYRCWFALRLPNGSVRMVSANQLARLEDEGKHSLNLVEMQDGDLTYTLDEWIERVKTCTR